MINFSCIFRIRRKIIISEESEYVKSVCIDRNNLFILHVVDGIYIINQIKLSTKNLIYFIRIQYIQRCCKFRNAT